MFKMAILVGIALVLRLYGINWDQWAQFHPDERMLLMVTEKISFLKNINPDFFNYGSLPIYILRLVGWNADYFGLLKIGRYLSIFSDLITLIFVYKIAKKIFKQDAIAYSAGFIYAVSFFPIQNSHFFIVDVLLTTLTAILIDRLIAYFSKPDNNKIIWIGGIFAAMMATKFTAIIFVPVIAAVVLWTHRKNLNKAIVPLLLLLPTTGLLFFVFMPYAVIDYERFLSDVSSQLRMNSNPYTFPYTLQFVGTLPYLYHLKNIFLWGLGPLISILGLAGLLNSKKNLKNQAFLLLSLAGLYYFVVIGRSSVKFMRYMLPLYPFLAIYAGYGLATLKRFNRYLAALFMGMIIVWTLAFVNVYSYTNTRIAATEWILRNVPKGSTLAVEYWDDRLPANGSENYSFESLPIYDQPDSVDKWNRINKQLEKSDYLIVASNRLYTPVMHLTDCKKYKVCYKTSAEYYKNLFAGRLNFKRVAEFSSYPGFYFGNFFIGINDQSADESFTVYDHPKILIFKKSH